jgi:hypothetical protein
MSAPGAGAGPDDEGAAPVRTLTMAEFLAEQEELERQAREAFPDEPDTCTYLRGTSDLAQHGMVAVALALTGCVCTGVPAERQPVYACLTCTPVGSGRHAGVCYGCSIQCHGDHNVIELYEKRDFSCDCGNAKFPAGACAPHPHALARATAAVGEPDVGERTGFACSLLAVKEPENATNRYNHNYEGRYCRCDGVYAPTDTMFQCALCEDWFHDRCLPRLPPPDRWAVLVCALCVGGHPVLARHAGRPGLLTNRAEDDHDDDDDAVAAGPPARRPRLDLASDDGLIPCRVADGAWRGCTAYAVGAGGGH